MSEPRPTVDVELGVTVPWGELGFIKPRVAINGIDPSGDVDDQVSRSLEAAARAFARIDGQLEVAIMEAISPDTKSPSISERLEALERGIEIQRKNIRAIADQLRKISKLVAGRVEAAEDAG